MGRSAKKSPTARSSVDNQPVETNRSTRLMDPNVKGNKTASKKKLSPREIENVIIDHQLDGIKIAWKLLNSWRMKLPQDDVRSIVGIALCEAAHRFDPSYETTFRTFFFYHLRGILLKEVSRIISERNTTAVKRSYDERDTDDMSSYYQVHANPALVEQKTPEHYFRKAQLRSSLQHAIEKLDHLAQEVVVRYYVHDQTIVRIAKELGYCRCHLSRVKNQALAYLGEELLDFHQANAHATQPLPTLESRPAKMRLPRASNAYTGGRGRRIAGKDSGVETATNSAGKKSA